MFKGVIRDSERVAAKAKDKAEALAASPERAARQLDFEQSAARRKALEVEQPVGVSSSSSGSGTGERT